MFGASKISLHESITGLLNMFPVSNVSYYY